MYKFVEHEIMTMLIVTVILHKILFCSLIYCQYNFNHCFNFRNAGFSKSSYISFFYLSMPIDNVSWRAIIGIYNTFIYQTQGSSKLKDPLLFLEVLLLSINYIFLRLTYYISYFILRFFTKFLKVIDNSCYIVAVI